MLHFRCPHCQAPLQLENRHLGQKVACGKCRQMIVLAAPVDATVQSGVPGNEPRRRRLSRKKMMVTAVLGGGVLLLGGAIGLKLIGRLGSDAPAVESRNSLSSTKDWKTADAKQAEDPDAPPSRRAHPVGEPDPDDLDKIVKNYVAASREDKPRFLMDPERVRPLMETYVRTLRVSKPVSITTRFLGKRTDPVEWYLVRATGQTTLGVQSDVDFPFRRTAGGFKIDWEALAGYNPTPLKVFMTERPGTASTFRVECELADYYNYAFSEAKDTHLSVNLRHSNPRISVHGYVSKDSPDGKQLLQLLRDGHRHNLTLELRHIGPDGNPINRAGSGVVSVTRLVSDSWVWE